MCTPTRCVPWSASSSRALSVRLHAAASDTIITFQGFVLVDAAVVDLQLQDGDSGAPYISYGHFMGIHSAYNTKLTQTAMSKAAYIAPRFNATIVL